GSGAVKAAAEGSTSSSHSAAFADSGVLSQTVTTVAGQTYNLDLDDGIFGRKTGNVQMRVQAIGSSTVLDQTVAPGYANTTNPNSVAFQHYHLTFVANSTSTTLQFSDSRTGNTATCDQVLDTVTLTAAGAPSPTPTATPTPTSGGTPTPT